MEYFELFELKNELEQLSKQVSKNDEILKDLVVRFDKILKKIKNYYESESESESETEKSFFSETESETEINMIIDSDDDSIKFTNIESVYKNY
jgi:hypothetical protein